MKTSIALSELGQSVVTVLELNFFRSLPKSVQKYKMIMHHLIQETRKPLLCRVF